VFYNTDIGYEIKTAALTDGTMEFNCYWLPLESGALLQAGAGGTL